VVSLPVPSKDAVVIVQSITCAAFTATVGKDVSSVTVTVSLSAQPVVVLVTVKV
jgi:hypothetical protein